MSVGDEISLSGTVAEFRSSGSPNNLFITEIGSPANITVLSSNHTVAPLVLGKGVAARQSIDAGLCVGSGCFLCGWSVLLEPAGRRKELALFVAPRAVAAALPRRYPADKQWRETLVFAASTAVVFTCALENKRRVRGILGSVLRMVLAT